MSTATEPTNRLALAQEISAHPFLAGMNHHQIALLSDCAIRTQFAAGEVIFREGEGANRFYLIRRGKVVLESSGRSGPITIDIIGAGDLLGWSWLFPPYVWHFTARAVEPTTAIFFYGTVLREYCERDKALGFELFRRMSEVMVRRLQAARRRMLQQRPEEKAAA